jgi:acyl-coenzyme A synthetase/AMP-(fatty) acid ligase
MTTAYPLIRHDDPEAVFAVGPPGPISLGAFLRDVVALGAQLPSRRYVANLCIDRYRFTVAFAAALLREQVTLLPPSDSAGVLSSIAAEYPDLYAIHDGPPPTSSMAAVAYPAVLGVGAHRETVPVIPSDQPAIVLFTSGSTGSPTPHAKTWGSLVRSSLAAGDALGVARLPHATIIGTVPQQHSYGFESTILLALQFGLAIHHARPFYPSDVAAYIDAAARPRILVTTPIHLRAILADLGRACPVDLVVSATAPLAAETARAAEPFFSAPVIEIYGCSEAGQLATRRTVSDDDWRCLDGVSVRQDAAGTWAAGRSIEGEVLLSDILEMGAPGRFRLHGRTADLVNVAGKRTSLAHLNHHLNSIDGVVDGVFLMPEESVGPTTRLMAFVVAPGLTAEAIIAALRQRIDPIFLPRPLRLVDALPRNVLGKLPREEMLRLADRGWRSS